MKWWWPVFAMELRKILAYRSDFWITFLGQSLIQLLVARALWQSIFAAQGTTSMEGYTLSMLSLYYLIAPIGTRMLTGENIGFLSREIYDGTFTRYLLYPLSVFQYKTITYFTHSLFYGFQLILIYSIYHLFYADTSFSLMSLLLGVSLFLLASLAYLTMAIIVELISLWADNIWTLMVMLRFITSFLGGGLVPMAFFPEWSLSILKWTPFPYLVALPIRTTMGVASSSEMIEGVSILVIWMILFSLMTKLMWTKGQKLYNGVGI